jgi:hypothetical protein
MTPLSMSFFDLPKFLPLPIGEIGSDLLVRIGHHLMDALTGLAPDNPQSCGGFVDDRRDLCDLVGGEIEFGAEPVLHLSAYPLGTMQFKEMAPGVGAADKRASNSTRHKHEEESSNEFPL